MWIKVVVTELIDKMERFHNFIDLKLLQVFHQMDIDTMKEHDKAKHLFKRNS